jgi:hypothetical protein
MLGFGWTNPFPLQLGGGISYIEDERNALLDEYEAKIGLSREEDTENYAESLADAQAVAIIWHTNNRLRRQAIPEFMLENLVVWEESTGLRPTNDALMPDRRRILAAKLRGQINNALTDIEAVAQKILGDNFVKLELVAPVNAVSYWPGVNPGPPGYEWVSNYAHIAIRMTRTGLTAAEFQDLRTNLFLHFNDFLPAWMTYEVGIGPTSGNAQFVLNQGILGRTLL